MPSTNKVCLPILGQAVCRWPSSSQEKQRRAPRREGQPIGAASGWASNGRGAGAMPEALVVAEVVVLEAAGGRLGGAVQARKPERDCFSISKAH